MSTRYPKEWSDLSSGRGVGAVSFNDLYFGLFVSMAAFLGVAFLTAIAWSLGSASSLGDFINAVVTATLLVAFVAFFVIIFFVIIVGAPLGYFAARAMRQVAPLWPHLLAFLGVGAFMGVVIVFVHQGFPWSPGMFASGDGEYHWDQALWVIGTAALCAAVGRLAAAVATKRRRYKLEHPTVTRTDETAEDW